MWQDFRYAIRTLFQQRNFALPAIVMLALGVGANTAIFSVVNAVLLRPLPYQDAERLMRLNPANTRTGRVGAATSPLNFLDWRSRNQSFEAMGGFLGDVPYHLSVGGEPERVTGAMLSDSLLPTLGVRPALGRNFSPEEDRTGGPNVVLLSHELWTNRFGANPNIVGQTITLSSRAHTVVGVMPPSFAFPNRTTALWVPFGMVYADSGRGNFFVEVIGKRKADVTPAQAQADLSNVATALAREFPQVNTDRGIQLVPWQEEVTGKVRPLLLTLLSAVGFVLLIACANVANLLLARAAGRQKEVAIRSALGASRGRIVQQMLTESLLLSFTGGALGLLLGAWGLKALLALSPPDLPRVEEITLDGSVLLFTLGVTLLTGVLFGLVPALQASRPNLNVVLKEGGRSSSTSSSLLRSGLVVAEVALSLLLLIGAGLLLRSFWRVLSVSPGFTTEKILTFDVALPWQKYTGVKAQQFFQQAQERLRTLPGVQSLGATSALPLTEANNMRYFTVEGRTSNEPRDFTIEYHRFVTTQYFEALGVPLLQGRTFNATDERTDAAPVVIINQAFARAYFPNQDPLGKRFKMGETAESPYAWMTVVGVVGNIKHASLEATDRPEMFRPYAQMTSRENERKLTFAIRTAQTPEALLPAVRREIQAMDSEQPLANIATMEHLLAQSVARRRFSLLLLGFFAATALALAAIGIYSVMTYTVAQSTREIGIRMALGAQARDVLRLVLGHGLLLTVLGVVIGLAGAWGLTRLMTTLLFNVSATDGWTYAIVAGILLLVAVAACLLPARRAIKVDPMIALRYE